MRSVFHIALFLCAMLSAQAQSRFMSLDSLALVGRKILEHPEFAVRDSMNNLFRAELGNFIESEENFEKPLDALTNVSTLRADDLLILTWQLPDSDYNYVRFGYIAAKTRRGIRVTELVENKEPTRSIDFIRLRPEEWYGAIYYDMVVVKEKGDKVYTLLGYHAGERINQKIVDILQVRNNGKVKFGDRQFYIEKFNDKTYRKPPMRLILRYNADLSSTVRWHESEEMIIMDHMSPPKAKLKGVYQTYGPDLSYDGLEWRDGWWHLVETPEFNTGMDKPIVPPDRPVDLPGTKSRGVKDTAQGGG